MQGGKASPSSPPLSPAQCQAYTEHTAVANSSTQIRAQPFAHIPYRTAGAGLRLAGSLPLHIKHCFWAPLGALLLLCPKQCSLHPPRLESCRVHAALSTKQDEKQPVFTKKYFLSSSSKMGTWEQGRLRPRLVGDLRATFLWCRMGLCQPPSIPTMQSRWLRPELVCSPLPEHRRKLSAEHQSWDPVKPQQPVLRLQQPFHTTHQNPIITLVTSQVHEPGFWFLVLCACVFSPPITTGSKWSAGFCLRSDGTYHSHGLMLYICSSKGIGWSGCFPDNHQNKAKGSASRRWAGPQDYVGTAALGLALKVSPGPTALPVTSCWEAEPCTMGTPRFSVSP